MVIQHCLVLGYLNNKNDFDGQGNWHDHPNSRQSTTMKIDENIEII
jgi:hypothetical protein